MSQRFIRFILYSLWFILIVFLWLFTITINKIYIHTPLRENASTYSASWQAMEIKLNVYICSHTVQLWSPSYIQLRPSYSSFLLEKWSTCISHTTKYICSTIISNDDMFQFKRCSVNIVSQHLKCIFRDFAKPLKYGYSSTTRLMYMDCLSLSVPLQRTPPSLLVNHLSWTIKAS